MARVFVGLILLFSLLDLRGQPRLGISGDGRDWARFNSSTQANMRLTLEATADFSSWQDIGTSHHALRNLPDPKSTELPRRFYRLRSQARTALDDWKNEILFPEEELLSGSGNELQWVKFAILLNDPTRVYFQDSEKFPFHYEFATQRLPGLQGMDRAAFDAVSLRKTGQQVVLGSILYPPAPNFIEYGVQFVGLEAYSPEEIAKWFHLVKATVFADQGAAAYYMPVFEQSEMARTNAAAFAALGIEVASVDRWLPNSHVYSSGWGFGRLKFFRAAEIAAAFADGRLKPEDILLTDGVPAETPIVAGIISLAPSTPNSHTALLAQNFGIPFVYLPDSADRARAQSLAGRKIILRASVGFDAGIVKVIDVEGALSAELEAELVAFKKPLPIEFAAKESYGAFSASTDSLLPTDIKFFGGKAANYGLLRRTVPTNSPAAIAFSFDLWDAFMNQAVAGGQTLRATIAARLAPYTNYPPNIPALKADLAAVRDLIRQGAVFTPSQQQAITNALRVFDFTRKIRFRSSTNVEDSEHFTGAGLYDSYSGCLLDDLDADNSGPSRCDPAENNERGVFRAIQRVYASFYNDNAFLERLRHGVDETKVAIGVLVHHSFPDEEELANGVATLRYSFQFGGTNISGSFVTQLGANSVTNPDGTSTPEVIDVFRYNAISDFQMRRRSSLVPLGDYVLEWRKEYEGFLGLFTTVGAGFKQANPGRSDFYLDFEYKKDLNLGLMVKQVREIPTPSQAGEALAFLVNEPTVYCVSMREQGDVFANHRLKSIWNLNTRSMRLTPANVAQGIYADGSLEYLSNAVKLRLDGPLASWPDAARTANGLTNTWTTGSGAAQRRWTLITALRTNVMAGEQPVFTQQDYPMEVSVAYQTPQPRLDDFRKPSTTLNDVVFLEPCPQLHPGAILREHALANGKGVVVRTKYYWPRPPGFAAGYTAPLVFFVETTISGLATQPIVLTNYYSQTYHPFHHNFAEEFIFEPALEPGMSASVLAELQAANIQYIYIRAGDADPPIFMAVGLDQKMRPL